MRTQEVRGLRKELERRKGWREDKGTQTDMEGVNTAAEWLYFKKNKFNFSNALLLGHNVLIVISMKIMNKF
jgi:hypothetical protein